jgi:hypothetical protein
MLRSYPGKGQRRRCAAAPEKRGGQMVDDDQIKSLGNYLERNGITNPFEPGGGDGLR